MPEQSTFFGRIGNWLRRRPTDEGGSAIATIAPPLEGHPLGDLPSADMHPHGEVRSTFLRPWAKRDAAIANLQEGFQSLTDLMTAVRDGLEKSASRQDELLRYLAHLPEALQSIPEGQRAQAETLRSIGQHLAQQNDQQQRLAELLQQVSQSTGQHSQVLNNLHGRVDNLHSTHESMSNTLRDFGQAMNLAMSDMSRTSSTSTQVLAAIREDMGQRDQTLERVLHKQSTRFTTMLAISIFLAITALVTVAVFGYLMLNHGR